MPKRHLRRVPVHFGEGMKLGGLPLTAPQELLPGIPWSLFYCTAWAEDRAPGIAVLPIGATYVSQPDLRVYRVTPRELDTYQACRYKFAADRRAKQQRARQTQPVSFALTFGNAVHDTLNLTNRHWMNRGCLPECR